MFRKFLASALSVLLAVGAVLPSMPAVMAAEETAAGYEEEMLPTNDLEETSLIFQHPEMSYETDGNGLLSSTATQSADTGISTDSQILARTCTDYGYKDMLKRSHPESRQAAYRDLLALCENAWNSTKNFTYNSDYDYYQIGRLSVYSYNLTADEAYEVYFTFKHDNPIYYFLSASVRVSGYSMDRVSEIVIMADEDYVSGDTRKSLQSKINSFITGYANDVAAQTTIYGKANAIRERLNSNMEYAYKSDGKTPEDTCWAHNIIGAVSKKKGVCESYAKTYQMLCNYYGVECLFVIGTAGGGNHAWNIIKLDNNKYYYADITWNDVNAAYYPTRYFAWGTTNFCNSTTYKKHSPFLPTGTSSYFQYELPSVPKADFSTSGLSAHTHTYTAWSYFNASQHRRFCSASCCAFSEYAAHSKAAAVQENLVAATCTKSGSYDSVIYCSGCGYEISRSKMNIPATGHTPGEPVIENATPSSCTAAGSYESVVYCRTCGQEISRNTVFVEAAGHTPGEAVIENEIEPTCTEAGKYDAVVYCSVCGEEISRETTIIPEKGHTDGEVVIENETEPTCTASGKYDTVIYCQVCGEEKSRETTIVPAKGHTPGETVIENETEPTCTEPGSYDEAVYCSVCGEELSRSTVTVEAPGHIWDDGEVLEEPTCTEPGTLLCSCTVCEETARFQIEPEGHKWNDGDVTLEPTCTEDGEKTCECTVCHATENFAVEALGHDWDEGETTTEPTCTETGLKVCSCSRCTATQEFVIDALGHDWDDGETTTEPTCTEPGEKTFCCSRCEEKSYEAIDPLGHDWDDGEVTTEPTCTEPGERTFCCSRCEEKSYEEIEALGHDWEGGESEEIEQTCTDGGYTLHHCSRCEETYTDSETPPLGHLYSATVIPPTLEAEGYTLHTCTRCGDRSSSDFVPKLISINDAAIKLSYTAFTYTGNPITVEKYLTVTYEGEALVLGTDYTASYENNTNIGVGTMTLTITGAGRFADSVTKKLTIKPKKNAVTSLTTKNGGIIVNWKEDQAAVGYQILYCQNSSFDPNDATYHSTTVTGKTTVTLSSYPKPGEKWYVKVRSFITASGTTSGTCYGTYSAVKSITAKGNLNSVSIPYSSYTYTGSLIKPPVTVKDTKGNKLTASDYTVTYSNNTKVGTATIKIVGKGSYQGTLTKTFIIKPKAGTLTLTTTTGAFRATWTRDTGATGYEIVYSKDKNFKTGVTTYNVSKNTTTTVNFSSKPKSGETWYAKYRAYITVNGTKYGNYSSVKSIKVK